MAYNTQINGYVLPLTADEIKARLAYDNLNLFGYDESVSNSTIFVTVPHVIKNGTGVTFKAPVACTNVRKLCISYPSDRSNNKEFTFYDANGDDLSDEYNVFGEGVLLKVILYNVDTNNPSAFIQNAATSAHVNEKLAELDAKVNIQIINWAANGSWENPNPSDTELTN